MPPEHDDGGSPARRSALDAELRLGIGALFALVGLLVGAAVLDDNSFFTHLATGRLILADRSVPSVDPYAFHSLGDPWVVQSWFMSVVYAGSEELLGLAGPRLVHALLGAAAAGLIWHLSHRAGSLIPRLGVAGAALVAAGVFWSERPLMIGVVGFGLLLVLWERGPLWTIVPLMWFWVNSHGSFPLAGALVVALFAGRWLDGGDLTRARRVLGLVVLGTVIGGLVSPVAGRILIFPVTLLGRSEILQAVPEWQSPDFSQWSARFFLVQLVLVLLVARRVGRWELVLPAVLFVAAALIGARNVPLAVMVLTPLIAAGAPSIGELRSSTRSFLGGALVVVAGAGALVVAMSLASGDHLELSSYPVTEVLALEEEGLLPAEAVRVAHPDVVGNFLALRHGATGTIFFDDRFDMYDVGVLEDMLALRRGRRVFEVLDRYEIDVVLWETDSSLADQLTAADGWAADDPLEPLEGLDVEDGTTGWSVFRRVDG